MPAVEYSDDQFASCVGVYYTVIPDPGPTPDPIILEPFAYGNKPETSGSEIMSAEASMTYEVTCYPMRLNLSGILAGQSTNRILIGQKLTATVDLGGFSAGENEKWFTWEISGGDPFESFSYTQYATTFFDWFDLTSQVSEVDFFYADPMASTVECTMNIFEIGLEVEFAKVVEVEAPTVTPVYAEIGDFQYLPNATSPASFFLEGASIPEVSATTGMIELVWVATPAEYWIGSMKGQYGWAQTITDRCKSNTNGTGWTLIGQPESPGPGDWLDHAHPYPVVGGFYVADGAKQLDNSHKPYFRDRPGWSGIGGIPTTPGLTSFGMRYDTTFHLFVMFDPPGSMGQTAEVPLRKRDWLAYGQFEWSTSSGWGTPTDSSDVGQPQTFPDHPVWDGLWSGPPP
jgi:hypothetical protein